MSLCKRGKNAAGAKPKPRKMHLLAKHAQHRKKAANRAEKFYALLETSIPRSISIRARWV